MRESSYSFLLSLERASSFWPSRFINSHCFRFPYTNGVAWPDFNADLGAPAKINKECASRTGIPEFCRLKWKFSCARAAVGDVFVSAQDNWLLYVLSVYARPCFFMFAFVCLLVSIRFGLGGISGCLENSAPVAEKNVFGNCEKDTRRTKRKEKADMRLRIPNFISYDATMSWWFSCSGIMRP